MARSKLNLGLNLLVLALALGLVNSQGGFFSNIRNMVFGGPGGGRPSGPPPNQRQPPPQQFGQGGQPPQQFNAGPQQPPQQFGAAPQQPFAPQAQQQQQFGAASPPVANNPSAPGIHYTYCSCAPSINHMGQYSLKKTFSYVEIYRQSPTFLSLTKNLFLLLACKYGHF